jgi:integrase
MYRFCQEKELAPMPRTPAQPSYRRHKARNCAVVTINGKNHYLGPYDSPASHENYAALIDKWRTTQGVCPQNRLGTTSTSSNLSVTELILAYWKFAKGYYVKDGKTTAQLGVIKSALRYVRSSYGVSPAKDFGPLALQSLQERMIGDGLCRSYINGHTRRIKLMFKWGVSKELLPSEIQVALSTVSGLKKGRSSARESKPVRPVPAETVEATLAHLPKVVADMVRFQQFTGCRPGEVCSLRPCDVDRTNDVWAYRPAGHKTEHLDRQRVIHIGPRAREVLLPYMLRDAESHCFSPAESEAQRKSLLREHRQTKVQPSQLDRRKELPKQKPSDRYTKDSYARAITRAADRAFGHFIGPLTLDQLVTLVSQAKLQAGDILRHRPTSASGKPVTLKEAFREGRWLRAGSFAELFPSHRTAKPAKNSLPAADWHYMITGHRWAPNQLRHSTGTKLRKQFGVEASQVILGHAKIDTTLIYAARDLATAAEIMAEIG